MPRGNKILIRTGATTPQAADFVASEPAWDTSAGKLYVKNAAGAMVEVGGGGSSSLASYSSPSSFPGTGSSSVLYLSTGSSRLYRWDGAYIEVGTIGGLSSLDGGTFS